MRTVVFLFVLFLACFTILMPSTLHLGGLTLYRPVIRTPFFTRDLNFKLGLDLQGGSHLAYDIDTTQIPGSDWGQAVAATVANIERRVNLLGVSEAVVQTSQANDSYRLIVELPGISDINQALTTIGATAILEFKQVHQATPEAQPEFTATDLSGADLKAATVQFDQSQAASAGRPVVAIEFTPAGAQKFSQITKSSIGQRLAIFLDDQLVTAPVVQEEISDGKAIISGDFTVEAATGLAIQLTAGALPLPIPLVSQKNIGATLGSESVVKSLFAAVIGLIFIWFFMFAVYGRKGLLANIALTFYIFISLSFFKLIPITLTLAGIAGFVLSVGMAVDANVLIFERIR